MDHLAPGYIQLLSHTHWAGTELWLILISFHKKVVLSTLEQLTPVARSLLGKPPQEEREPCNLNCFMEWKQEVRKTKQDKVVKNKETNLSKVMMVTSRGQPGKGCGEARQYADLAFSLACRCNKTLIQLHQQIERLLFWLFIPALCSAVPKVY